MTTIIFADSLTHDFAFPLPDGETVGVNVGLQTIARTMGTEERYGKGPLPAFLHAAAQARHQGRNIHLVFVRDLHDGTDENDPELVRFGRHAIRGTEGAEFVPCVTDLVKTAHVIETSTLALPTRRLHEILASILGADVLSLNADERRNVTFVVCGFHTNVRVASTAFKLRNEYEFPRVLVCPHLVGAADAGGHALALQVGLPNALVRVVPSLADLADELGLEMDAVEGCGACRIEPPEQANTLTADQRTALQLLFLSDTSVSLARLGGGFSGSHLFLATPSHNGQRKATSVVKVSQLRDIQRETDGYLRVRDLLGPHVPSMHPPVAVEKTGALQMSLAAMKGQPVTLQRLYGEARDEKGRAAFMAAFETALSLLARDLHENTRRRVKLSPYQALGLTGPQHERWLRGNLSNIVPCADLNADTLEIGGDIRIPNPVVHGLPLFALIDHVQADIALCHGDLNFANLLKDELGAIWIIDWPWCDDRPIETDFAKLENDVEFVLSQAFTDDDLPLLLALQRLLAETLVPPPVPPLDFIEASFEMCKLYHAVRLIRERYRSLKTDANLEMHAIARLRYALHTLSFNKALGRGDCELPQLKHALLTVAVLIDQLRNSPLHSSGPRERPDRYPPRVTVPVLHDSWDIRLDGYAPPDAVSEHGPPHGDDDDVTRVTGLRARTGLKEPLRFDEHGRPLNPLGRTGLGGRGFFYRWGPNLAVDAVVMRVNPGRQALEFALVKRDDTGQWSIPGTMLRTGESPRDAFTRVAWEKLGLTLDPTRARRLDHGPVQDYRNTDHAWVESMVFEATLSLSDLDAGRLSPARPGVKDAAWLAVDGEFATQLFASHACILAESISRFLCEGATTGVKRRPLEDLLNRL